MSFTLTYNLNDEQFEAAMEHYDYEDMEELRSKIRDTLNDAFQSKVVSD